MDSPSNDWEGLELQEDVVSSLHTTLSDIIRKQKLAARMKGMEDAAACKSSCRKDAMVIEQVTLDQLFDHAGIASARHVSIDTEGWDPLVLEGATRLLREKRALLQSLEKIRSLVAPEGYSSLNGKVSANNWKMIENATSGQLIVGTKLTNSSVLYTAPPLPSAVAELLPSV